jgi:hypothetical protein
MNRYSIFFPWFSKVFLCVEPGTSQRCLALEVWQLAMVPIYLVAMLGVEYLGADVGICWVILRFVNPAWDLSRWWMGSNCLNDSWIVDWFILVHANVGELCRNCFVGNSVFEIFIYSSRLLQKYTVIVFWWYMASYFTRLRCEKCCRHPLRRPLNIKTCSLSVDGWMFFFFELFLELYVNSDSKLNSCFFRIAYILLSDVGS